MPKSIFNALILCLTIIFSSNFSLAKTSVIERKDPLYGMDAILKLSDAKEKERNIEIKKFAIKLMHDDPEMANKFFNLPMINESPLGKLIEDSNVRVKVFEPDNNTESASLGLNYSYNKNHQKILQKNHVNYSGIDFAFNATGNITFDKDTNPYNFQDTKLKCSYFLSHGGVKAAAEDPDTLARLDQLTNEIASMKFNLLKKSSQWQEFKKILSNYLTDQYFMDVGLDAGMESDQSIDKKQFTIGLKSEIIPRGWSKDSILGKVNILDFLPAFIRRYSGVDEIWQPRGSAFPSLLLGIDRVAPDFDGTRDMNGDKTNYTRFLMETAFKTLVTTWESEPVYLEASFRCYYEADATRQVKNSDLEKLTYFKTTLRLPKNLFASYSTGRLPLDMSDDKVFEIGIDYIF